MTDYNTLIAAGTAAGSIKNQVNRENTPSASIVEDAEAWIYQRLRIREMIQGTTGTLTTSIHTIPLPTDFLDPANFMFTADGTSAKYVPVFKPLDFVLGQWAYDGTGARVTGRPRYWAVAGTVIQFDNPADRNYVWRLDYYRSLPALGTATASSTNIITSKYRNLIKAACFAHAFEWDKDDKRGAYWFAKALAEMKSANEKADQAYVGAEMNMEVE